jgi:drug/metabolite transporter (DMT)-like permease
VSADRARGGALAVPLLALLWGLNWPAVRIALSGLTPWSLRAIGLGCGAALLFALARARGQSLHVPAGQRLRVTVSALFSIVGFNLCTAFAQLAGSTSRAAIVTFTMPVWAVLLAWLFAGERPDARRTVAVVVGAAGLGLLAVPLLRAGTPTLGVWLSLAAGLSWAAGTVYLKRFPLTLAPMASAGWQLAVGALVAIAGWLVFVGAGLAGPGMAGTPIVPSAAAGPGGPPGWSPAWVWGALVYHVAFAMALAYLVWFDVVARLPAGIAALGTLLVPVVGVVGAMALLGERPSAADLGGFALITLAAAIALRASLAAPPAQPDARIDR